MPRDDRIRIGNQTAFSASTVTGPFDYAIENGFDAFEWFPDKKESGAGWQTADIEEETREDIKRRALEHDVRLSVHASWQADPLDPGSRDLLLEQFDFGREIGAKVFNIHLYAEQGIRSFVRALEPLVKRLSGEGMQLSIENTPLNPPAAFKELFDRLRNVYGGVSDRIGMCLDLGHANLSEATRNDYIRYMDLLDPAVPIIHIHLHENYGDADSHLPIFTGPSKEDPSGVEGFVRKLKERRFSGMIILEQWPQPPDLLKDARNRLLELFARNGESKREGKPAREAPAGPEPPAEGDIVGRLVYGNAEHRSWREKLGFVHDVLTDEAVVPDAETLAYLAVYLRFVGTGEIPSLEEGGHHRPSHHARMAGRIYARLAKIADDENRLVLRKIYPWLPSFDSAFTSAEPLTRIRDIAHRNDIPHELKTEIKHTLQNKLHRNAGPEDLATSEALLKRISAQESGYPEAFVREFRKFHEELKEFFNARSLEQDLKALASDGAPEDSELIRAFLESKEEAETLKQLTKTMEQLIELRRGFSPKLQGSDAAAQRLRTADIRLEDYSFVLMSRLVNRLQAEGLEWAPALKAVLLSVEGLRLSAFEPEECRAAGAEARVLEAGLDPQSREWLLRLKAALERCRRLAEGYSDRMLSLFTEKAEKLGSALGVSERAVRVFVEADIRRNPVFQLSKLVSVLLKEIGALASLPPWTVIVPGKVSGLLRRLDSLDARERFSEAPVLALLEKAGGDEEIPPGVAGVVTAQDVPLLSHLAVRARQRNILFVVCEDRAAFEKLGALAGKRVGFNAAGVAPPTWKPLSEQEERALKADVKAPRSSTPYRLPEADLSSPRRLLSLDEVSLQSGGSKAFGAKKLQALSRREGAGFEVPKGVVVPFGAMEEAVHSDRELQKVYSSLARRIDSIPYAGLEDELSELKKALMDAEVPAWILSGTKEAFGESERLMVRSSSNGEDLERLSGAGLYESVANVSPSDVEGAVKEVWASLWTKRATMSRKFLGIPHEDAHMAVFIQQMLVPELSFILHTFNPVNAGSEEVLMELAVGLGETLASGRMTGTPYRLTFNKRLESVQVLSFASYSQSLRPGAERKLERETVDYSAVPFTNDPSFRERLAIRLGRAGRLVETAFGRPQDVEGLVAEGIVHLVQSRPQQGEGVDEL